jgi:membrane protein implicated in regulation of membrane protease activity
MTGKEPKSLDDAAERRLGFGLGMAVAVGVLLPVPVVGLLWLLADAPPWVVLLVLADVAVVAAVVFRLWKRHRPKTTRHG